MRTNLHSFNRCCLPKMPSGTKFRQNLNLQQFKVIQGRWVWYQSICDFLLVINSNFGPILHRFWDTATYWTENCVFFPPLSYSAPRSLSSHWNFMVKLSVRKTRVMGLLCGEGCMILTSTVFDWSTGVTDRRTDGRTGDSIQRAIVLRAKNERAYRWTRRVRLQAYIPFCCVWCNLIIFISPSAVEIGGKKIKK